MRTTMTTTFIGVSNAQTTYTTSASPTPAIQKSPWHSPVPYLFGGLAAMLGLIAFALLILACSYWRLTGREEDQRRRRDLETGDSAEKDDSADSDGKSAVVYEEKVLVIMAGDEKPTFLATPVFAKVVYAGLSEDGKGIGDQMREKEVEERESNSEEKVKKDEVVVMVVDHDDHESGENSHDDDHTSQERNL